MAVAFAVRRGLATYVADSWDSLDAPPQSVPSPVAFPALPPAVLPIPAPLAADPPPAALIGGLFGVPPLAPVAVVPAAPQDDAILVAEVPAAPQGVPMDEPG